MRPCTGCSIRSRRRAAIFRALKPGGRFAGEMGGEGNIATLARRHSRGARSIRGYALPVDDPQLVCVARGVRRLYAGAGFTEIDAQLIPRPTPLPSGVAAWVKTFRAGWLDVARCRDARDETPRRGSAARRAASRRH